MADNHGITGENDFLQELAQYFPEGTSEEEILEIYNDPEKFQRYIQELQYHYAELQENFSVYEECVIPVTTQMWDQVWQIILFCLLLRMLALIRVPRSILNVISTISGFWLSWKFYGHSTLYCLIPAVLLLLILKISKKTNGLFLCLIVTAYLIACETTLMDAVQWNKVKGSVMIVFMKIVSICFDVENGLYPTMLPIDDLFGYVFNPASIIFGPFITFKDYELLFNSNPMSISWLFHSMKCLFISLSCLLWSSCGTSNYLPKVTNYITQLEGNRWWNAYMEAQQFRFSHYFVSYFSEATCLVMGVGSVSTEENKKIVKGSEDKKKKKPLSNTNDLNKNAEINWSRPVANMLQVETPRSLVDVVTNWNLPMHYWLKQYIFKSTRKFGVFLAILCTYTASSILHGFNFQLSAVLLSIGLFAYVESVFRHSLASGMNACIEARSCKKDCTHHYKKSNFMVICANLLFSFIAVWNLAYLGCLFDNSGEEEKGYSMKHALNKWKHYDYLNHLIMFGVLILQRIISYGRIY